MNILALDIATATGFAYNQGDRVLVGTWQLASPKEIKQWGKERLTRRRDPRVERLCENVAGLGLFDAIVFEDVTFSTTTLATQMWAALRSALWLCGVARHFECVPVQTLKKFAVSGGADKLGMSNALKRQHPELWRPEYTDDAIDAIWIWLWGHKNLARMKL